MHLALDSFRELRIVTGTSYVAEEITSLQFLDRYHDAQVLLDHARNDAEGRQRTALPTVEGAQVWQWYYLGRLDDAAAGAQALLELARLTGSQVHVLDALTVRTAVALMRGEARVAAAQLRLADRLVGIEDSIGNRGIAVVRGWVAATNADLASAVTILRPLVEGARADNSFWPLWPCWMGIFYRLGRKAQDDAFAASCIEVAETAAQRNPGVASFEGIALVLRGVHERDPDTLAAATTRLESSPRPALRAIGAEAHGRVLIEAGRLADGTAELEHALREFNRMGARASESRVRRALALAGQSGSRKPPGLQPPSVGWASLTEAERRVALLIAAGCTNRAASSKLGISVNTIGTHLRAVFAKLGIQSRVQLANASHDQLPSPAVPTAGAGT